MAALRLFNRQSMRFRPQTDSAGDAALVSDHWVLRVNIFRTAQARVWMGVLFPLFMPLERFTNDTITYLMPPNGDMLSV